MSRCSGFCTCVRSPKTPIVVGLLRDLLGVLATARGAVSWAWSAAAASAATMSAAAVSAAAVSAAAVFAAETIATTPQNASHGSAHGDHGTGPEGTPWWNVR